MGVPVQQVLAGMPARRPRLSVHTDGDGRQLVVADRAVALFGPFEATDLGARNLAMVALTQMGFGVGEVAGAFGLRPGTLSELRTAFRREGSAGVVKGQGRPARLDEAALARAHALRRQGWTQQQVAAEFGVSQSAVSQALARHRAIGAAGGQPTEQPVPTNEDTEHHEDAPQLDQTGHEQREADAHQETGREQDTGQAAAHERVVADRALVPADEPADGQAVAVAGPGPRIEAGAFESRYAGAMLAHAYLDRAGAGAILAGLGGAPWRRFDQAQVSTLTVLALLLGVGSVEQVKTLIRAQAGPLTGLVVSPGLDSLRPRLAGIADRIDVPDLQTRLATAMLAMPGHETGLFYVDDHFVPYAGAKPVAMGHNGKRDRGEKGRADTLVSDARGRAICFTTAEPTHLSKTMHPVLAQLRAIVPSGPILLGFDRGGAYAEAFTACRELDIDFLTYRRGKLASVTATPIRHRVRRGRTTVEVILADQSIRFSDDYTGPCRQLTLFERATGCTCQQAGEAGDRADDHAAAAAVAACPHLIPVLQVLTSDLSASAPDLLFALKGRWVIENAFKYLDFYGIDWLLDYHAEITANTKLVDNPARAQANAAIRAAKTAHAEAERAFGQLLTGQATAAAKNAAIPAAQAAVAAAAARITEATAARDGIPVQLPANLAHPGAARALLRTHRRGLVMALRLLAYNTDTWLADHLNVYLRDPNEYRAITRSLMHQPGVITYTPQAITVTLHRHHTPRINRALTQLLDELNTTPAHLPGDPRPLTYQLAAT